MNSIETTTAGRTVSKDDYFHDCIKVSFSDETGAYRYEFSFEFLSNPTL